MVAQIEVDRRKFLKTGATGAAALVLSFYLPSGRAAARATDSGASPAVFMPNAWVRITPDNQITLLVEQPELGQGSRTAIPMMIAEELEADWSTIRVEQAPVIPEIYKNLITGGSYAVESAWGSARKVGAQAREMLITGAAQRWAADRRDCRAEKGTVVHVPTGRRFSYGELVEAASQLPLVAADDAPLKAANHYRFIGKAIPRTDTPSKVDGSAMFGIDIRIPDLLYAVIARCPYFGGKLASCDDSAAKAVSGVRAVFPVPPLPRPSCRRGGTVGGVAVVANSTWAAIQGRKALKLKWDKGPNSDESTESLRQRFLEQKAAAPAFVPVNQGDSLHALAGAGKKVDAFYELPFQAHATMEPMNTTVDVRDDRIEVWSPTQVGAETLAEIIQLSGLPANKVIVHMTLCGGSFGRRAQWDYQAEAWQVANQIKRPVQTLWTREDDIQHDYYRQYSCHCLSGLLDNRANLVAWSHRILSTSIHGYFDYQGRSSTDPHYVASLELGGADILPYSVPNFHLEYSPVTSSVPRAWWRSVTNFNAFAMESFIDELAHAASRDPYEFRMNMLRENRKIHGTDPDSRPLDTRRLRTVLQLAAEKSGWGKPLPAGHGRGIACHYLFNSYMAQVAEVSMEKDGTLRVHRVVSAVDCGTAVNPDGVQAMTEGGINFALTEVLTGEITIKDGAVEQSNFHDYQVLRLNQAPDIEVHIVPSAEDPGGMGETAVPPLAPAVANAFFAATGKRLRRLPVPKNS